MAKIIELIYTEERVGKGTDNDPVRMCPQLWSKEGKLIAHKDPYDKHEGFIPELIKLGRDLSDIL